MKKSLSTLAISLILSACASTNSQTLATDAKPVLGKITDKQTIQQYAQRRASPVDINVGVGGGSRHVGWGINFGLAQIFNLTQMSSPELMYRYTIQTTPNESFVVQTPDEFKVNDCVTVWQRPSDATYPRLRANSTCSIPLNVLTN